MSFELFNGDCLEIMPTLPAQSVDAIICDPPYGVTSCKWDSVIPFPQMWECIKHVIKPKGAVVLFGSQPFASALVMSNPKWFKHEWIWIKERGVGFMNAKKRPMMQTENVSVFSSSAINYYPQMTPLDKPRLEKFASTRSESSPLAHLNKGTRIATHRYPKNVLQFSRERGLHPTQKHVDLMAYLVRTYTNEGGTVLDFTCGSGSTGVACVKEGRNFIGIEKQADYFDIARQRIEQAAHDHS